MQELDEAEAGRLASQEIRDRIALLVKDHSLRGLGRKLGVSYQSISRYLKGAQPTALFCNRLVEKLGVNPSWLLTGEGARMLSDVTSSTSQSAGDLLELVNAMEAVTRMRIGALAGKQHAAVLRELNEALHRYETLRGKLDRQSRGVFEDLIEGLGSALFERGDLDLARSMIKGGEQVGRLCHDKELHRNFRRLHSNYAHMSGDMQRATDLMREVALDSVLAERRPDAGALEDMRHLAMGLRQAFRLNEAHEIVDAGLVFARRLGEDSSAYHGLIEIGAILDLDLGNLARSRERLVWLFQHADESMRQSVMPRLANLYYLAGEFSYSQVCDYPNGPVFPFAFSPIAIWSEDAKSLRHNAKLLAKAGSGPRIDISKIYVDALLSAVEGGKPKTVLADYEKRVAKMAQHGVLTTIHRFITPIVRGQLAYRFGDQALLKQMVTEVEKLIASSAGDCELPLAYAAIHYRSILRCDKASKALRAKANAFFERCVDAGYGAFRQVLPVRG